MQFTLLPGSLPPCSLPSSVLPRVPRGAAGIFRSHDSCNEFRMSDRPLRISIGEISLRCSNSRCLEWVSLCLVQGIHAHCVSHRFSQFQLHNAVQADARMLDRLCHQAVSEIRLGYPDSFAERWSIQADSGLAQSTPSSSRESRCRAKSLATLQAVS